jgi:hypothetical protein
MSCYLVKEVEEEEEAVLLHLFSRKTTNVNTTILEYM